jgi:hypothetical protein
VRIDYRTKSDNPSTGSGHRAWLTVAYTRDKVLPWPLQATFESQNDFPHYIVESMRAADGTTLTLSLWDLGPPKVYVRAVNERVTEVGAFAVPAGFSLEINDAIPAGQPEAGPLAEAPPVGADVQNLWYE